MKNVSIDGAKVKERVEALEALPNLRSYFQLPKRLKELIREEYSQSLERLKSAARENLIFSELIQRSEELFIPIGHIARPIPSLKKDKKRSFCHEVWWFTMVSHESIGSRKTLEEALELVKEHILGYEITFVEKAKEDFYQE